MVSDISDVLRKKVKSFPLTVETIRYINTKSAFLKQPIIYLIENKKDRFWSIGEEHCYILMEMSSNNKNLYFSAVDGYIKYSFENLKAQMKFLKAGFYHYNSFNDVEQDVYVNRNVMEGFYLNGLFLTQIFWAVHFILYDFFLTNFIPKLKPQGMFCDIGVGHGLHFYKTLSTRKDMFGMGLDVSKYSLRYTRRLLTCAGLLDKTRCRLMIADITKGLGFGDGFFDAIIFGEVLEHLETPETALYEIYRILHKDGLVYLTTALNSDAIDHISVFRNVDGIRNMICKPGFQIVDEKVLPLKAFSKNKNFLDPTIDYGCILRKHK